MGSDANQIKCPCGTSYAPPSDPAAPNVCPSCKRPATVPTPVESGPEADVVGLDKILIEKGWVTADQIKTALAKQEEELAHGKKIRIGEALVALGFAKPEQIREALATQGRTPMRCPTCKKTYNVKSPKPGTRIMCKTCRVPLTVTGSITDLHADDTGTGVATPIGEKAEAALADLIPGYAVERRIASGGMGEVFLGRQKVLDRPVAIKLLPPDLAEARSAAKLSHENIVGAVDAGEAKGRYYFVMEYVQGENLHQIVQRDGALSEHRALEIARQVVRGLKHAHQHGLIHRDIKSANIMIGLDGTAKICDFGLAREVKVDARMTQPGMVYSSPSYSSPEQCKAQKLDHRSDMYSLGVTLFEMLTGKLPFAADAPSALFVAHATQQPPNPKSLNAAISPAANQLVLRLLKKHPDSRFKDYDELLAAIEQAEKPAAPAPLTHARTPLTSVPPKAPAGKNGMIWTAAGAAAVLITVVLAMALKKGGPSDGGSGRAEGTFEKQLKEARAFEQNRWGKPDEYPAVRARWKGLVDQHRGTAHHNEFAGPLLEFEERVKQEAASAATDLMEQARTRIDAGKIAVALGILRTYSPGYESTPASGRITTLVSQLEANLDQKLVDGKEQCWSLIATEKFDAARRAIEELRSSLGYIDETGPKLARPSYKAELEGLEKKLDEEIVFARKRAAEAAAKAAPTPNNNPPPPNPQPQPPTPKPTPKVDPAPVVRRPDPVKREEPVRLQPPTGAVLKQAEDLVQELFKADYARKSPGDKVSLARKLVDLARQTKDDPTGKYALYVEARDLAASGGDPEFAYRIIDEVSKEYVVNAASMKSVVLSEISLNARTPEELKSAATAFLLLADEALEIDDYAGAERAAGNAVQMARRAKDIPLLAKATAKAKECGELKSKLEKLTLAREALKKNPEDPAANQALGEHLCFVKNSWDEGLKHLAKAKDPALKALAEKDLARPAEVADQVAVGDGWWDLGEKSGDSKDEIRKRAAFWYEQALPRLAGFHKTRIEKRIEGSPSGMVDLLRLIDPEKDGVQGTWEMAGGSLISPVGVWHRLQVPYVPPEEYDLTLVVERKQGNANLDVGLAFGGRQFHVGIDGWTGEITGLNLIDSKPGNSNETTYRGRLLPPNTPTTVTCSVRRSGVALTVGDKQIFDWKGDYGRLSAGGTWKVPRTDTLFIGAYSSKFAISRMTLTSVAGAGQALRGAAPPSAPADVNLLSHVDPAADSVQGTWKLVDGKLVSPLLLDSKFASCTLPYSPPEEYDLTLVAERRTGRSALAVGLVAGGKQFDLELDGHDGTTGKSFSGLDRVDGVWPPKAEVSFRGGIFTDRALHKVVVRVRKTSVVVLLDGQQVLSWTADYRRVSAPHPLITVRTPDALFLAAWQSEYAIQQLTVKPVSGQGRLHR